MDITPGEPVPPGFEEEVKKAPQIQSTLDQYKGNALIGVEYTVELHESDRQEPGYLCVLCDKRGDARTILSHWSSFNHRIKYLEKHFPSVVREFQPVKYQPNSHNILILIVQNLAEAIEDFHGRLQVKMMDADDFRRQKTRHTESIMSGYHYDEKNGPNLLSALDRTLFEHKHKNSSSESQRKTQKRFNNSPTSGGGPSKSSQRKDDFDAISSDSDNPDSSKRSKPNSNQPNFANDNREEEQGKKLPTPKELSLQASHIAQERYKWEKYRCMLEIQLKQMEKLQNDYEKSPEKHPHYPEEWKKFWNRRYKELQAEKKVDPNKYDYKPEWIVFWTKRMKEFFSSEVEKIKKDIKIKLGLPEEAEEKVDQLKERYKIPVNRVQRALPMIADVIDISDDEAPYNRRQVRPARRSRSRSRSRSDNNRHSRGRDFRRRSRSLSRSRSRSLSPFSDDYDLSNKHHRGHKSHRPPVSRGYNSIEPAGDYYKYSSSSRYPTSGSHGSIHPYPSHPSSGAYRILDSSKIPKYEDTNSKDETKDEPEEETGPLTVVGVLRLLTALEEQLGSLGPKVVDLLGKALALEKVKANSSDDLLLNEDHCVFFETIKEKLKGLLIADVVEDPLKVRAVKRAIKNIAGVIYQVQKGSTNDGEQDNQTNESGGVVSASSVAAAHRKANAKANAPSLKDLPFDRQTIATKLAAALVLHGREDVSTEDMDKLIYLFLLMVKLSKAKRELDGKPLYCKNILPELGLMLPSASVNANAMAALAALPAIVEGLLENENSAGGSRVPANNDNEYESETTADKDLAKSDANSSTLESLTDSDLQTLLQNFKHLSSEEQHHLIAHLKKLELVEPDRVEKLRKFVNVTDIPEASGSSKSSPADGSKSNFVQSSSRSNNNSPVLVSGRNERRERAPGTEPTRPVVNPNKFSLDDDDDDDYNFDEVFKAASKNVNQGTPDESSRHSMTSNKADAATGILTSQNDLTFNPAGLKDAFSDTQNLIANLMGSLQQSNSITKNNINNKASSSSVSLQPQPVPPLQSASNQQTARMPQMQHHQHPQQQQQQQQQQNMAYYQQQQNYQGTPQPGAYNQMSNAQANYYNAPMGGGYNQAPYANGAGYPQWGAHNMQPSAYGMHNYGMPQNQMPPAVGYNMYGQGGGN